MFKRLNKAREIKRINLNKLKHVHTLKFTDNQIQKILLNIIITHITDHRKKIFLK